MSKAGRGMENGPQRAKGPDKESAAEWRGRLRAADDKHKQYNQITVRRTAETSRTWKTVHVALFALVAVFGFQACYCYGRAFAAFNFNCVLDGAELAFVNRTLVAAAAGDGADGRAAPPPLLDTWGMHANDSDLRELVARHLPPIDYQGTSWGSPCACNFVQFMPLVQMIAAVVWGAFFVGASHGGGGLTSDPLQHPWRIVGPLLVFCALMLVPLLVAYDYSGRGYADFCAQFEEVLAAGDKEDASGDVVECDVDVYTTQFSAGRRKSFRSYITTALILEKLSMWLWIGQLVVTLVRIVTFADFQINRITMKNIKQETVVLTHEPAQI